MTGRRSARAVRNVGVALLVALMFVAALHATVIPESIDSALRSAYYRAGGGTVTDQRVLLLEADDDTIDAWGAPGWSRERADALLRRVRAGGPAAIVVLDGDRMFRRAPSTSSPADGPPTIEVATRIAPGSSNVESLADQELPLQDVRIVLASIGQELRSTERIQINYTWPASRLPSIGMHRIEQGDVPSSIFSDKVVVVGMTSHARRDLLPTPVGALTSPEIVAHAFATVVDERRWYEPTWLMHAFGLLVVLGATAIALRRTTPAQAVLRAVAIGVGLLLLDYVCFSTGLVRWGIASELLLVTAMVLGHWYVAQQDSAEIVERVSDNIAGHLDRESATVPADDERLWEDMVEVAQAYVGRDFVGMIAELPAGGHHLEPRAYMGMNETAVVERRRDIRRAPFRAAFLTHRAHRCERRFLADEDRWTLSVPLAYQGRLYGMWMLGLDKGTDLNETETQMIEELGTQLGHSIAAARRQQERATTWVHGANNVSERLSQLVSRVDALGEDKQQVADTFDALPMGLLVADIWGHIVRVNGALRESLADDFPDGIPNSDLRAVLSRITGASFEGVHRIMRTVMTAGKAFRLPRSSERPDGPRYLLMPMENRADTDDSLGDGTPTHLVLMEMPADLDNALDLAVRTA